MEETIGVSLYELGLGKAFLDTPKAQVAKEKSRSIGLNQNLKLCFKGYLQESEKATPHLVRDL